MKHRKGGCGGEGAGRRAEGRTHHVGKIGGPVQGGVRGDELAALVRAAVDERGQLGQLRDQGEGVLEGRLPELQLADALRVGPGKQALRLHTRQDTAMPRYTCTSVTFRLWVGPLHTPFYVSSGRLSSDTDSHMRMSDLPILCKQAPLSVRKPSACCACFPPHKAGRGSIPEEWCTTVAAFLTTHRAAGRLVCEY